MCRWLIGASSRPRARLLHALNKTAGTRTTNARRLIGDAPLVFNSDLAEPTGAYDVGMAIRAKLTVRDTSGASSATDKAANRRAPTEEERALRKERVVAAKD